MKVNTNIQSGVTLSKVIISRGVNIDSAGRAGVK